MVTASFFALRGAVPCKAEALLLRLWSVLGCGGDGAVVAQASFNASDGVKFVGFSRRCGAVLPMPLGLTLTAGRGLTPPWSVVHRLRLNTMQRPGHTGRTAIEKKKKLSLLGLPVCLENLWCP